VFLPWSTWWPFCKSHYKEYRVLYDPRWKLWYFTEKVIRAEYPYLEDSTDLWRRIQLRYDVFWSTDSNGTVGSMHPVISICTDRSRSLSNLAHSSVSQENVWETPEWMNECYRYAGRGKFVESLLVIRWHALTHLIGSLTSQCSLTLPTNFVSLLKSTLPQRKTMNKKTKTKTYKTCVLYTVHS
jgi:hypothetical protein